MIPFSLIAFSLVYFVGLVSQTSDIPFSSKCQIIKAFHIPNQNIPVETKIMLGSLTEKFVQMILNDMNWKTFPPVLFYFIVKK